MSRNIFSRIKTFMHTDPIKKAEDNYLNGSTSIFDLEFRQRQIDEGLFRPRHRQIYPGI